MLPVTDGRELAGVRGHSVVLEDVAKEPHTRPQEELTLGRLGRFGAKPGLTPIGISKAGLKLGSSITMDDP